MPRQNDHLLTIMQTRKIDYNQYNFETLSMPHWSYYISPNDVDYINKVVNSIRYAGNVDRKLKLIKTVMEANGFKRFAGGTNRVVYRHMEDTRFLAKIAIDKVGMSDNPNEFRNQEVLKPFCAKMFQVTPCGTIGFSERVIPIMRRGEFEAIAGDVYEILESLLDKYILEDVGTNYFMNWGISSRIGPVLLDYPYIYELDHKKLICKQDVPIDMRFPDIRETCNGFIDYDDGFNHLYCSRCKRKYNAVELKKYIENNQLIIREGGSIPMKVSLVRGKEVIKTVNESEIIAATGGRKPESKKEIRVSLTRGGKVISSTDKKSTTSKEENAEKVEVKPANVSISGGRFKNAEPSIEVEEVPAEVESKNEVEVEVEVEEITPKNVPETLVDPAPNEENIEKAIDNSSWEEHKMGDEIEVEEPKTEMVSYYAEVAPNEEDDDKDDNPPELEIVHGVQEVIDDPAELNAIIANSVSVANSNDPVVRDRDKVNVSTSNVKINSSFITAADRNKGSD